MNNLIKIFEFFLLILASIALLYFFSERSNISNGITSYFERNNISNAWLFILILFVFGFFIWKDWNKIKSYNKLSITDTILTTVVIVMPILLIIALLVGFIRGDF